jgi:hypothetical protein
VASGGIKTTQDSLPKRRRRNRDIACPLSLFAKFICHLFILIRVDTQHFQISGSRLPRGRSQVPLKFAYFLCRVECVVFWSSSPLSLLAFGVIRVRFVLLLRPLLAALLLAVRADINSDYVLPFGEVAHQIVFFSSFAAPF